MIKIYFLDKNDNVPFYIGYSKNPKTRINSHRKNFGIETEYYIIDEIEPKDKEFWESYYIGLFKSWGFELQNKNNGGGGPLFKSKESIDKYKQWRKDKKPTLGKKQSIETRNRKSVALKGKPKPKGFGDMMREVRQGKTKPEGTGDKISKALKGRSSKKAKIVEQFSLNGKYINEYPNTLEAGLKTNSNPSTISKVCRGIFKQTNGFIWKYK